MHVHVHGVWGVHLQHSGVDLRLGGGRQGLAHGEAAETVQLDDRRIGQEGQNLVVDLVVRTQWE